MIFVIRVMLLLLGTREVCSNQGIGSIRNVFGSPWATRGPLCYREKVGGRMVTEVGSGGRGTGYKALRGIPASHDATLEGQAEVWVLASPPIRGAK